MTLISIVRIPVELILYWLFLYNWVPELMTFSGINFDILAGLTTPFVIYLGIKKNGLKRNLLLTWNVISMLLLLSIRATVHQCRSIRSGGTRRSNACQKK